MHASPARHRAALAIALLGVAVSAVTLVVHERLAASAAYTSFCNFGGVVNCDTVLGSRYATVLGFPVAAWGLLAFGTGALLALPGALGRAGGGLADLLLLGLASASVGFALVLAFVSATVLHTLCLLCATLDLVILAWFVSVAPLVARFDARPAAGWWRGRSAARAMAAAGLVLAVAGGTWAARGPGSATNAAEVKSRDVKFYEWYTGLPVRPVDDLVTPDCHRKGPPGAAVAIVEFSDFQCPFCVQASRDLRELQRAHPDVSIVFRHFPLDSACNRTLKHTVHPDACLAACAAECAGRQGRFWDYHDVLFENHEHLERDSLFRYARDMQLDIPAFRSCLDDPATRVRVGADVEAGAHAGVGSTPTLFFNGRTVEGALDPVYYEYALIIEKHVRDAHAAAGAS
jgi:uncharacterized membrane protein/predicted DsbA family dithiol-disulfide isomerase